METSKISPGDVEVEKILGAEMGRYLVHTQEGVEQENDMPRFRILYRTTGSRLSMEGWYNTSIFAEMTNTNHSDKAIAARGVKNEEKLTEFADHFGGVEKMIQRLRDGETLSLDASDKGRVAPDNKDKKAAKVDVKQPSKDSGSKKPSEAQAPKASDKPPSKAPTKEAPKAGSREDKPESTKKPESAKDDSRKESKRESKTPEPTKKPESSKKPESTKKPEPSKDDTKKDSKRDSKAPEPTKKPESTKEDSKKDHKKDSKTSEPAKKPEPAKDDSRKESKRDSKAPEPAKKPESTKKPEPSKDDAKKDHKRDSKTPEPAKAPEPSKKESKAPEPAKKEPKAPESAKKEPKATEPAKKESKTPEPAKVEDKTEKKDPLRIDLSEDVETLIKKFNVKELSQSGFVRADLTPCELSDPTIQEPVIHNLIRAHSQGIIKEGDEVHLKVDYGGKKGKLWSLKIHMISSEIDEDVYEPRVVFMCIQPDSFTAEQMEVEDESFKDDRFMATSFNPFAILTRYYAINGLEKKPKSEDLKSMVFTRIGRNVAEFIKPLTVTKKDKQVADAKERRKAEDKAALEDANRLVDQLPGMKKKPEEKPKDKKTEDKPAEKPKEKKNEDKPTESKQEPKKPSEKPKDKPSESKQDAKKPSEPTVKTPQAEKQKKDVLKSDNPEDTPVFKEFMAKVASTDYSKRKSPETVAEEAQNTLKKKTEEFFWILRDLVPEAKVKEQDVNDLPELKKRLQEIGINKRKREIEVFDENSKIKKMRDGLEKKAEDLQKELSHVKGGVAERDEEIKRLERVKEELSKEADALRSKLNDSVRAGSDAVEQLGERITKSSRESENLKAELMKKSMELFDKNAEVERLSGVIKSMRTAEGSVTLEQDKQIHLRQILDGITEAKDSFMSYMNVLGQAAVDIDMLVFSRENNV